MIHSERYGELRLSENQIIRFGKGIIGIQEFDTYGLVAIEDTPFFILHALQEQLSFIVIPAEKAVQDYGFHIDDETIELLRIQKIEEVVIFLIVNIIDDVLHVNLKAPILIAPNQRTGCQFIIHQSDYPIRHPLTGKEEN
ncbi:flagellar assembly protein FliW [Cohnella cholangitidis]|uniref:Flagellar assembly factor FliW n=1 Tax=Cohnella cholangitidis TaxID=2598458 RepID=A0A7G5C6Z6_9BACL|nr:flagellar assembly protein FliW [Cohnella cholangitidis]